MSNPTPESRCAAPGVSLPYFPGLDGLRALAVAAVVLYHAGLPVRGGFIGVEMFFALSGFLITALLVDEQLARGRIDLRAFWARRARRLLPALAIMLLGVVSIAATLPPGEAGGLGSDLLAAVGYMMNWQLVASGESYFDATARPSLIRHLWSLAIEEQFYLLWPLLFSGLLRWLRPIGLLLCTIGLAVGSGALAGGMYDPGADPSRVYYGTDTRASGLLIGAALALVWAPWRQPGLNRRGLGRALDVAGALALAGLGLGALRLFDSHPLLYRGGLIGVALLVALVIAAITHPQARMLPAALGWAPVRWLGTRSYGVYLWHWPVFQVTRPYLDLPLGGPLLLALRLATVLLLAELSYRLVETPVRRGALGRLWGALSSARRAPLLPLMALAAGGPGAPALQFTPIQPAGSGGQPPRGPAGGQRRGAPIPPWRGLALPLVALLVLMSASCTALGQVAAPEQGGAATPSPLPAAEATVAERPSATHTLTPTTAPTVAPSATSTATATVTATPISAAEATATAVAALPAIEPELAAALQAVLDRTIATSNIPGAVVAVHIPGRQPWVGASGMADVAEQTAMTAETQVRIASISKVFTAATVLLLVEEGRLSLDDTLDTWYPDLVPGAGRITVRHLLQHRTGLYDYLEDRQYAGLAYQQPGRAFTPAELVGYAADFPPAFRAGAEGAWDYSSTNYVILGMVVEAVTGRPLAVEMRERIFEPLGLTNTFFAPDEPISGPFATGNTRGTAQREVAMSFAYATANLVSTAADMQAFGAALFEGNLLGPAMRAEMLSFVGGKGQYNMPSLAYGLGVMRNVLPVGRADAVSTVYGHIGGFGGFRSALWHAPESGITIALGVNQGSTDPNTLATALFDAVLDGLGR